MMRWLITVLVITAMVGCGDGVHRVPIQGVLTGKGEPVAGATVQFIPDQGTPDVGGIGQTDAEGKFTLISSRQQDAGIPPGKYRVRVTRLMDADGTIIPADAPEADYPMARESVPLPYSGIDSPLKAEVSDQGGEIKLEIPVQIPGKAKS